MENYDKRIGELERDIDELKEVLEFARKDQEQSCKIAKKLLKENNQLRHENNMLINQLNFKTLDDDDMVLIKRLNNIYDNEGFDGVVDYAKSQLCGGGVVREENGLNDKCIKLQKESEKLRHELDSLSGCYCADNKEFKDYWRIGYDD